MEKWGAVSPSTLDITRQPICVEKYTEIGAGFGIIPHPEANTHTRVLFAQNADGGRLVSYSDAW